MSFPCQRSTGVQPCTTKSAKTNDLERVKMTINGASFPNLSNKSRAVLSLLISLVKLGYTGISAPVGAIEKTLFRVGFSLSRRSLFRALADLESHGYFHRRKYRVGNDKFGTEIVFTAGRFDFWKKPAPLKIPPTIDHKNLHVPNWQEDPRTKIPSRVNSRNINNNSYKKPRARAGVNKIHPVLYTLSVVLTNLKAKDRAIVLSRARCEIEAERQGIEVAGHSGAHWDRPSWLEMPHEVKESICRREILPLLRNLETLKSKGDTVDFFGALTQLEHEMEIPAQRPQTVLQAPPDRPPVDLSRDDLAILEAASARARRRVC